MPRPQFHDGIGVIDRREDTLVQEKTVARERGGVAAIAGRAHHHLHSGGAMASAGDDAGLPGVIAGSCPHACPELATASAVSAAAAIAGIPQRPMLMRSNKAILTSLPIGRADLHACLRYERDGQMEAQNASSDLFSGCREFTRSPLNHR